MQTSNIYHGKEGISYACSSLHWLFRRSRSQPIRMHGIKHVCSFPLGMPHAYLSHGHLHELGVNGVEPEVEGAQTEQYQLIRALLGRGEGGRGSRCQMTSLNHGSPSRSEQTIDERRQVDRRKAGGPWGLPPTCSACTTSLISLGIRLRLMSWLS